MANIHWKSAVSADFNTAADWSTGTVPGASDNAILDAKGAAFTVSTSTTETVNSIQLASNATLSIDARTFTATNGTGSGANAGAIDIVNNEYAAFGGTTKNTGQINLQSSGNDTRLTFIGPATLDGGGKVTLTDNINNTIAANTSGDSLTNVDNTISGSGDLGYNNLAIINQSNGVIDATGSAAALIINTGTSVVTNAGLMEGTGSAALTIQSTTVANTGTLLAATGSAVNLQGADIQGGTLATAGTGAIQVVDRGSLLDGTKASINNAGVVNVLNNEWLSVAGTIANGKGATINLNSIGNDTRLIATAANATITGGGVVMSDNANNTIQGTVSGPSGSQVASTLVNKTTISGAGLIGNAALTLVNTKTIDATGANVLYVDVGGGNFTSSSTVTNTGLLEATNPLALTGTGGLRLYFDTIANGTVGVIEANGTATHVDLQSATIQGGTLITANGGIVQVLDRGSLLDGTANAVNNTGALDVLNNEWLYVQGAINNTGTINLQSSGNDTRLRINASSATFTGGGQIVLSDISGNNNTIDDGVLTNVDNTISGAGLLGGGATLTLTNQSKGVIDATGTDALTIDTGNTVLNQGLIEGTGTGGLIVESSTINDSSGSTILAASGSRVALLSSTIVGGTLKAAGSGVITVNDRGSLLDGASAGAVTLVGTLDILNNQFLYVQGTIDNTGTINLQSSGNDTRLRMNGSSATLTGGGQILLSDVSGNNNTIDDGALTNVNNTISGAGLLGGGGGLTLTNQTAGVVDATGTNALTIDTGNTVANQGLLEATGAGGLVIESSTINDSSGSMILAANGSNVALLSSTIIGGILKASGSGVITANDRGSLLDGASAGAVMLAGTLDILNNQFLYVQGTIDNTGTINLESSGNDTRLRVNGTSVTFDGGGQIVLSDVGGNNNTIDNGAFVNVDNTISGAGLLGGGSGLTLTNQTAGVIDATGANALIIDTNDTVTNQGLIEATGTGGLLIESSTIDGSGGGAIKAAAGSSVTLQSSTIHGGTLTSIGSGFFQIDDRGSTLDGTAAVVTNAATFNVTNNNYLYIEGSIDNTGSINLLSTGNDTRLRLSANTTLTGNGVIFLNGNPNNTFDAVAGGLTLTNDGNTLEGSGSLFGGTPPVFINGKGGVVDGNQAAALVLATPGDTITNMGTLEGTGAGGLTVEGVVNGSGGTVFAGAGSNVTFSGATLTGGGFTTAATGEIVIGDGSTATIDSVIGNAGTIFVDSTKSVTSLVFDKSTSLTGGGVLELSGEKNNIVQGTKSSIVLTNVDNTIEGGGKLGNKKLTLVNQAGGVIDGDSKAGLMINTGSASITNAGLIEATDKGKLTLASAVMNTGTIEASGGTLTLQAAVTGAGAIVIVSGTLDIANANAAENVAFTGKSGTLELDQSQTYTGQVSGFSTAGKDSLDLRDIAFISGTTTASYAGNASSGVLTVTDGTHTAQIHLTGNYLSSTFTVASDKHGGTTVTDPAAQSPHAFVAAAAVMGGSSGAGAAAFSLAAAPPNPVLATPMHA